MLSPTDSEIRSNLIEQTADLRFSVRSVGLRNLLIARGYDPMKSVKLGCDQGDDVLIYIVLSDSTAVQLNYREHYRTRQAIRIVDWQKLTYNDRELEMAKSIVSQDDATFDEEVRLHFRAHMADHDSPLAPLDLGDRLWHEPDEPPE